METSPKGLPYSPPDPRKGLEREIFLRALAGRKRLLDMQFGNGSRAALALCETGLSVTALGTESVVYAEPCAGYLGVYFRERLEFQSIAPDVLAESLEGVSFEMIDAIHIDGSAEADVTTICLKAAATHARPGTVLILTAADQEPLADALRALCAQAVLTPYGDLLSSDQSCFIVASNLPAERVAPLFEPSVA